jgi:hypothetical protein
MEILCHEDIEEARMTTIVTYAITNISIGPFDIRVACMHAVYPSTLHFKNDQL